MKIALVNGQRQEAQAELPGTCAFCGSPMVARCGEVRAWHWAHKGHRLCDAWWENETAWHRAWKDLFPADWQEVVHRAEDGEKHIADVKTDHGWVIEFQHSYIKPEERRSREGFYKKLVWVVDGLRRERDGAQFRKAWEDGRPVGASPVRLSFSDECRLLREWSGGRAPVFFDFGHEQDLVWLMAGRPDEPVYITPFPRAQFVALHHGAAIQDFESLVKEFPELIATSESQRRAHGSTRLFDPLRTARSRRPRRL